MNFICKVIFSIVATLSSYSAFASWSFERSVGEIQVLADRVRVFVGVTYGTCGVNEGWWGWSTSDPRHKDWLSMVLAAQAGGRTIVVTDVDGSCGGTGGDIVGLEALSIK